MKNVKYMFCLLVLICSSQSFSMLVKQDKDNQELFENNEYGRAQKFIHEVCVDSLALHTQLRSLTDTLKKSQKLLSLEEKNALSNTKEHINRRLDDVKYAYDHANALIRNEPNTLIRVRVHLFYAFSFLADTKQLLEKYENIISSRQPRQQPKAKL